MKKSQAFWRCQVFASSLLLLHNAYGGNVLRVDWTTGVAVTSQLRLKRVDILVFGDLAKTHPQHLRLLPQLLDLNVEMQLDILLSLHFHLEVLYSIQLALATFRGSDTVTFAFALLLRHLLRLRIEWIQRDML